MIPQEGKGHIKRYLAGYVPSIGSALAFGIGDASENASDTSLSLEVSRAPINSVIYDFAEDKLVFKATIPSALQAQIYEVGLFSNEVNQEAGDHGSRGVLSFVEEFESWTDLATGDPDDFVSTQVRFGGPSLNHTPAASSTKTSTLGAIFNLSEYSATDSFTFAYYVGNGNTSQISFRFLTDASNYYRFDMGAQTSGYKFTTINKGSAVVTGSPSWDNISEVRVLTTSGSGGASDVVFDAIRLEDKDTVGLDYVLVARSVVSPIEKVAGTVHEVEYSIEITI